MDEYCEICHAREADRSVDYDGVETRACGYCSSFVDISGRVVVPNEPV